MKMPWNFRPAAAGIRLFVLAVVSTAGLCGVADAGITLPEESEAASADLRSYLIDVRGGHVESAADRYWALAGNHDRDLVSRPDGTLVSVREAIDAIPADALSQVVAQLRKGHGTDAAAAISAVTGDPRYRPNDLYAAAMKCRHTAESDAAINTAANRAAEQGDAATAALLSNRPPTEAAGGPVPFAAPWYGHAAGYADEKVIPVAAGETIFLATNPGKHAGRGHLLAISGEGHPQWVVDVEPSAGPDRYKNLSTHRGGVSVPGIVTDDTGRAQIVMARFTGGTSGGWLAAYRAGDGRPLWSTADTLPGFAVLSSPTVAGRFAYCVGLEPGTEPATADLQMIAVDVTDGRPIWRTHLAAVSEIPNADPASAFVWPGYLLDQGPPLVSGGSVVVAPGIGAVVAVDRVDGNIRWIRPYSPAVLDENRMMLYRRQRMFDHSRPADFSIPEPFTGAQELRWTNTPVVADGIVVAAPTDTDLAFGIDLATGTILWQSNGLPHGVPVVAAGGKVVWAGQNRPDHQVLVAVDPKSGQGSWMYEPVGNSRLTGMPVVAGNRIVLWSSTGRIVLDESRGTPARDRGGLDFDQVTNTDAGLGGLKRAEMTGSFLIGR